MPFTVERLWMLRPVPVPFRLAPAARVVPVMVFPEKLPPVTVEPPRVDPARLAPARFAPPRLAPARLAPPRLVAERLAPPRLLPPRFAPPRLAPARLAPARFVPPRLGPDRFAPARFVPPRFVPPRLYPARFTPLSDELVSCVGGSGGGAMVAVHATPTRHVEIHAENRTGVHQCIRRAKKCKLSYKSYMIKLRWVWMGRAPGPGCRCPPGNTRR